MGRLTSRLAGFSLIVAGLAGFRAAPDPLAGSWRAVLDLAGGQLPFHLDIRDGAGRLTGSVCNGPSCTDITAITRQGDSIMVTMADYDATVAFHLRNDSLVGTYRNVGNRGPRAIPVRASRGRWPAESANPALLGSWDATFITDQRTSPRVVDFRTGSTGLEASFRANSGDYGLFWGRAEADSFRVAHFDGAFVYLLSGKLTGDTLRGVFHAGIRTQTPFVAVRSSGKPHLVAPTALTRADTTAPFQFAFPDLDGRIVANTDPRFRGKVVMIDIFGSWCPTCHDAAPALIDLHRRYAGKGLEVVGFAYEVSPDSAAANPLIRRFRDKFQIPYLLLRGGINDVEATAATLPQLTGFTAYPTTVFLGRDGRVKAVYAGFRGPATGEHYRKQLADYERIVTDLLGR
jgi:thiol-disulfide isomerase/thioredoxin